MAIGLARQAIDFVRQQSTSRRELVAVSHALTSQLAGLELQLLAAADGMAHCDPDQLRTDANSLVLRATQSAMVAAKGAAFVEGHPVGRWCREALFFLVWSCPQNVASGVLCEFAGIQD
jgi:hypothetical protein